VLSVPLTTLPPDFCARALHWAAEFPHCAYFEPNGLPYPGGPFDQLLAVATDAAAAPATLPDLRTWLTTARATDRPVCGFVTYDVKNEIEALTSENISGLAWPDLHFFQPYIWLHWRSDHLDIHGDAEPEQVLAAILATPLPGPAATQVTNLRPRMSKAEYLQAVTNIREDILNGEVYELNLCQEFYAEAVELHPIEVFLQLSKASPTPFAGFYRHHNHYLLCASPERFLSRRQATLISQPIKGTIRRGTNLVEDKHQRDTLLLDEKERAENLMIVDLVRNDLARIAETGTVHVPELFGLYPFRHVWQMISTVQAELHPAVDLVDILRATFPMGSMTGAPKIRAMQLIEQYEHSRRGLYSGSMGYVWPTGEFEFNVVIRSLQYRSDTGYLNFQVGSAITYDSVPEREYEECLLKAQALLEVLNVKL